MSRSDAVKKKFWLRLRWRWCWRFRRGHQMMDIEGPARSCIKWALDLGPVSLWRWNW